MHNWLDAPSPDRGADRGPLLFNERLAQREVARAGLLLDLANSFLVVAHPVSEEASAGRLGLERDWVARHYSLGRRAVFHKRATLRHGTVTHEPAPSARSGGPDAAEVRARIGLTQRLAAEPYARGDLLVHRVLETIAAEGVGDGFGRHVAELRDWIAGDLRHGRGRRGDRARARRGVRRDVVERRRDRRGLGADRRGVALRPPAAGRLRRLALPAPLRTAQPAPAPRPGPRHGRRRVRGHVAAARRGHRVGRAAGRLRRARPRDRAQRGAGAGARRRARADGDAARARRARRAPRRARRRGRAGRGRRAARALPRRRLLRPPADAGAAGRARRLGDGRAAAPERSGGGRARRRRRGRRDAGRRAVRRPRVGEADRERDRRASATRRRTPATAGCPASAGTGWRACSSCWTRRALSLAQPRRT